MSKESRYTSAIAAIRQQYPSLTALGIKGSVGGSWSKTWVCPNCDGTDQLVAWQERTILFSDCINCLTTCQLSLFGGGND